MTALNDGWFTEVFQDQGTAFSLQVKKKLHENKPSSRNWKSGKPKPSAT